MEDPLETTAYLPTSIPDVQEGNYTYYPLSNAPNVGPNPVETLLPPHLLSDGMSGSQDEFSCSVAPQYWTWGNHMRGKNP